MTIAKLTFQFVISGFCGIVAGMLVVTPLLLLANTRAEDGPYFPALLIAPFLILPIAFIIVPFQLIAVVVQHWQGPVKWQISLPVGTTVGLAAGLFFNFYVLASSASYELKTIVQWSVIGIVQGVATFASLSAIGNLFPVLVGRQRD